MKDVHETVMCSPDEWFQIRTWIVLQWPDAAKIEDLTWDAWYNEFQDVDLRDLSNAIRLLHHRGLARPPNSSQLRKAVDDYKASPSGFYAAQQRLRDLEADRAQAELEATNIDGELTELIEEKGLVGAFRELVKADAEEVDDARD